MLTTFTPHLEISELFVIIAFIGISAQWLAWRFHIPAIFLLLLSGLIVGPGLNMISPGADLGPHFYTIIEIFVALILFEGGMNLHVHELKDVKQNVGRLIFHAVPIAWILGSLASYYIGGLPWSIAMIFSAIIIVTGPTVIMPLLRHTNLQKRPATYLKWEGIINDPIGALLTVVIFNFISASDEMRDLVTPIAHLLTSVGVGIALGYIAMRVVSHFMRVGAIPEFLKPLILLVSVFLVFIIANRIAEHAGLMATTLFGLFLANTDLPDVLSLRRFKESITLLLLSTIFVLLAADITWQDFTALTWQHYLLLATVVFVLRPVTILLATIRSEMTIQERLFVGWIAPRGIVAASVAAVLSHRLNELGVENANILMSLVFSLILITVILHGFSIKGVAKLLGLASLKHNGVIVVGAHQWSISFCRALKELDIPVLLADVSWARLSQARLDGIPVYYGEILSEDAEQNIDFGSIGAVLACTDNDAYNSLVCSHYIPEYGRSNVFQISTYGYKDSDDAKEFQSALRGHTLHSPDCALQYLIKNFYFGWRFQKTKITESYSLNDYRDAQDERNLPIAIVTNQNELRFISDLEQLENIKDAMILSYTPPKPATQDS